MDYMCVECVLNSALSINGLPMTCPTTSTQLICTISNKCSSSCDASAATIGCTAPLSKCIFF